MLKGGIPEVQDLQGQCPDCGCPIIAKAGASVSCPRCARRVDVPRHPIYSPGSPQAERPAAAGPAPSTEPGRPIVLSTFACVLSGLLAAPLFWRAHSYLDRSEPLEGPAAACLGGVILLALAAVAFSLPDLRGKRRLLGYAFAVATPLALVLAALATVYNAADNVLLALLLVVAFVALLGFLFWALVALLATGIVLLVKRSNARPVPSQWSARRANRFAVAFVLGWGLALAHALASLYILATFPHQVEQARDAHQMPGLAFLALAAILVGTALWHRRVGSS